MIALALEAVVGEAPRVTVHLRTKAALLVVQQAQSVLAEALKE